MDWKKELKRAWNFLWHDDSLLSWLLNIIIAFVLVKFILYPALGAMLGTSLPVVAVVSGSMEHNGFTFDEWWDINKDNYRRNFNISKEDFGNYSFVDGFNKGDLMILVGADEIDKGDIIVFSGSASEPIIHRVVVYEDRFNGLYIQTKGDNNFGSLVSESGISLGAVLAKAKYRIPYLGWVKIGFLKVIGKA